MNLKVSINYYLKERKSKKKSSIRVAISYRGYRILSAIGCSCLTDHWDHKKKLPKIHKENDLYIFLQNRSHTLLESIKEASKIKEISKKDVRELILEIYKGVQAAEKNVLKMKIFIKQFINDVKTGKLLTKKGVVFSLNTLKTLETTLKHYIEFESHKGKEFALEDISSELINDFKLFLTNNYQSSKNTISKHIGNLRLIFNYAAEKKLISTSKVTEVKFNAGREESDNIYLNEYELEAMINLNSFDNTKEEIVRDYFIIGAFTGLRFANYSSLDSYAIKDDTIEVISIKTNQKLSLPILQPVKKIIEKYSNGWPKSPSNQEFNKILKKIGSKMPELDKDFEKIITKGNKKIVCKKKKWQFLMTHTARRSFCTNLYLKQVPIKSIMAISGHKSEKNFHTYIKASLDEHFRMIREAYQKNDKSM
ncbi:MAG TPA: hypothetical protein DCQ29_07160 [Chitinophagaceae bacterium]|nr:hypothetical protein [Chitinophagaceae bacterium]